MFRIVFKIILFYLIIRAHVQSSQAVQSPVSPNSKADRVSTSDLKSYCDHLNEFGEPTGHRSFTKDQCDIFDKSELNWIHYVKIFIQCFLILSSVILNLLFIYVFLKEEKFRNFYNTFLFIMVRKRIFRFFLHLITKIILNFVLAGHK